MNLDDVNVGITKNKRRTRVGRGVGSGVGKTSGRGHKGAKSRSGYSRKPVFQGGAMPLVRRVPKRGFNNKFALKVAAVNLGEIDRVFAEGAEITPDTLLQASLVHGQFDVLKVLGDGEVSKRLTITAHRFSKSAREKIEQAGGQVVVLPGKKLVGKALKLAEQAAEGGSSAEAGSAGAQASATAEPDADE
jgi:large subunit ribosomal protein L15